MTSDALAYLTVAETAVPYASSASTSAVRIERLASIEARLLASAAAVRERMMGGASKRSGPTPFSAECSQPPNAVMSKEQEEVVVWSVVGPTTLVPEPLNLQWLDAAMTPDSRRSVRFSEMMTVKCVAGRVTMADDGEFDGRGWDAAGSHRPQRFWHLPSTLTNYVYLLHPAEPDVCMDVFTVRSKRFDGPSENQVR